MEPVLTGPAGQEPGLPRLPPQKEQEQTTATGDSPMSLLAIPTPGASPGQPSFSPEGPGDQPSSRPASLGVQPCSPTLCNNQGPWEGGGGGLCLQQIQAVRADAFVNADRGHGPRPGPRFAVLPPLSSTRPHPFSLSPGTEWSLSFLLFFFLFFFK